MRLTRSRLPLALLMTGLLAAGAAACGSDDDASSSDRRRPGRHDRDTATATRPPTTALQPADTAAPADTAVPADSAAPADTDAPASDVTLRLGYFPNVTHAPAIIGVDTGLFQDALGSTATLETSTFNSGTEAIEAMFSGAIDATLHRTEPGHQQVREVRRRGAADRRRHHLRRRIARGS